MVVDSFKASAMRFIHDAHLEIEQVCKRLRQGKTTSGNPLAHRHRLCRQGSFYQSHRWASVGPDLPCLLPLQVKRHLIITSCSVAANIRHPEKNTNSTERRCRVTGPTSKAAPLPSPSARQQSESSKMCVLHNRGQFRRFCSGEEWAD